MNYVQCQNSLFYPDYYFTTDKGLQVCWYADQLQFTMPLKSSISSFTKEVKACGFKLAPEKIEVVKTDFISPEGSLKPCKRYFPILNGPLPVPTKINGMPTRYADTPYNWTEEIKGFEIALAFGKVGVARSKVLNKIKRAYGVKTDEAAKAHLLRDLVLIRKEVDQLAASPKIFYMEIKRAVGDTAKN